MTEQRDPKCTWDVASADFQEPKRAIILKNKVRPDPLCLVPEKAMDEVAEAMVLKRMPKKFPEWDHPRNDPTHGLIAARRDMAAAKEYLADQRRKAEKLKFSFDSQWEELTTAEDKLRRNFIKFNKFVKENQEKRIRAARKIEEEVAAQYVLNKEVEQLRDKVAYLKDIQNMLKSNIKIYTKYETFLEAVVLLSGNLANVAEAQNRYEALTSARDEISRLQEKGMEELEQILGDMQRLAADKTAKVIALNTELADLDKRYDRAKALTLYWESGIMRIKELVTIKKRDIFLIQQMAWDTYVQISKKRCKPVTLERDDLENQLCFIKESICELRKVVARARELTADEERARNMDYHDIMEDDDDA